MQIYETTANVRVRRENQLVGSMLAIMQQKGEIGALNFAMLKSGNKALVTEAYSYVPDGDSCLDEIGRRWRELYYFDCIPQFFVRDIFACYAEATNYLDLINQLKDAPLWDRFPQSDLISDAIKGKALLSYKTQYALSAALEMPDHLQAEAYCRFLTLFADHNSLLSIPKEMRIYKRKKISDYIKS